MYTHTLTTHTYIYNFRLFVYHMRLYIYIYVLYISYIYIYMYMFSLSAVAANIEQGVPCAPVWAWLGRNAATTVGWRKKTVHSYACPRVCTRERAREWVRESERERWLEWGLTVGTSFRVNGYRIYTFLIPGRWIFAYVYCPSGD